MDQTTLLILIFGGAASFFIALFMLNRAKKKRELKKRQKLHNASRAPLSSMRASRSGARHDRRHVVSRSLQLDQLSEQAREAYEKRQRRRVEQFSDLQLVMDEIFIPERDAVETEDEESEEDEEDRSTWISENEDNLNAHADLVAEEEVGTGISVRVSQEEDLELMERLAREGGKSGVVQISLAWDDYNDLDMHVFCPSGERIYFNNRKSACGGELDVDMNVRPKSKKPIENVVWTEFAPDGEYKIGVHFYRHHRKRRTKKTCKFRLRIVTYGQVKEYSGELTSGDPMSMITAFLLVKPDEEE